MRVFMYGPDWPRLLKILADGRTTVDKPPFETQADTLGDAIRAYEAEFGAVVTPCDGSLPGYPFTPEEAAKYFICKTGKPTRFGDTFLVDIHIERAGETVCPKQDVSFPLMDCDLIEFCQPVC